MLKIKIDHKEIYIKPAESIRFELPTGFFDSSSIPSSRILPFNAPVKGNEDIFEWLHLSYKKKEIKKLNCEICFYEVPIMRGKLYVTKTNAQFYRMSIVINGFSEEFNAKMLNELELGEIVMSATSPDHAEVVDHATDVANGTVDAPYRFPLVAAEKFYGSVDETEDTSEYNYGYGQQTEIDIAGRFINLIDPVAFGYHSNWNDTDGTTHNEATLVPMFKLMWVMEKILETQNYQLSGGFIQDAKMQLLLMMNNRTLDKKYSKYAIKAQRSTEDIFDKDVLDFDENEVDPDALWNTTTNIYTVAAEGTHSISLSLEHKHPVLLGNQKYPYIIIYVYKNGSIETTISSVSPENEYSNSNLTVTLREMDIGDTIQLVCGGEVEEWDGSVWRPQQTSMTVRNGLLNIKNISYSALNQYETSIFPERHLPDLSISKFFTAIKQTFGLVYLFDTRKQMAEVEYFNNILKGKSIDISRIVKDNSLEEEYQTDEGYTLEFKAKDIKEADGYNYRGEYDTRNDLPADAELNDSALVLNENAWFTYTIDEDDSFEIPYWKFYSDRLENLVSGDGKTKISPNLAPVAMTMLDKYLVPRYDDEASSPAFNMEINPMDLRLMFDYGKYTIADALTGDDYDYPFASSQDLDVDGASMSNMSLQWPELLENYLADWLHYQTAGIKATARLKVEFSDFFKLVKLVLPRVSNPDNYRFVMINGKKFLPEQLTFIFSGSSIKDCEIKMRRKMDE